MDTPHVIDVTEMPQPDFKGHPHKLTEIDLVGALSSVPYGVFHVEEI